MLINMKIVSWNVNSVKARLEHVKKYLESAQPDVLMIQELKGLEFPHAAFETIGYKSEAVCQKAYNGVAVISKEPIEVLLTDLPGDDADEQARYIEFDYKGLRLINIYLPNGNPTPGDKYDYKLRWMDRLHTRLSELRANNIEFAIGGDFNVIPEAKDCFDTRLWEKDALYLLTTRAKFRSLINLGLTDAFRVFNNAAEQYTFWDYQRGAWQKDHGIRIDHFLTSPSVTDKLVNCTINREPRGWEKASDHTPIMVEIDWS